MKQLLRPSSGAPEPLASNFSTTAITGTSVSNEECLED